MSLVFDSPVQPILEMSADPALWQRSAFVTDPATRWRIYLHQLGAAALLSWCQETFEPEQDRTQLWPEASPLDIWHVVSGLVITLGERRIVVMLSEAMDAAEMRVPQEWVDLPDWAGDYYIAAQVDADEQRLALWGYAPYAQVKGRGRYDADERVYCLEEGDLIQDFSVFWVAQQLEQLEAVAIASLPSLLPVQLDNLIGRLARSPHPRLEIPFGLWGALLSNDQARARLYQQRQQGVAAAVPVDLSQWANQLLSQGWEALDALMPQLPTLSFRAANRSNDTTQTIATGGKVIVLDTATETIELVLAIALAIEADERRNIRIQLYPKEDPSELEASLLPAGVRLTLLLTESGEPLQTVRAGNHDDYIQLPPFRCPAGQRFSLRIQQANATVQENFMS